MSTTESTGSSWFSFNQQDMMVFILIMSLHGLQQMFTELLPEFTVGGIGIEVGPFLFVSYALVFLFRSFWGCLAVPVGDIVFAEILIGDFNALGAVEGLIVVTIMLFFAMSLITDPDDVRQLALLAVLAKTMEETMAWLIDIGKFYVGVEELEAIQGLPETVWVTEGVGALVQIITAGIIFGAIPLVYFYPRLRRKIEPLLGMEPVSGNPNGKRFTRDSLKALVAFVVLAPVAFAVEVVSETSGGIIVFEPEFVEIYGQEFLFVPIVVATVVAFGLLYYRKTKTAV